MHSLIISVMEFIMKSKKRKQRQIKRKIVNYEKIFDSDEEILEENLHKKPILPTYIYEFNFEKLFKDGIHIQNFNSNLPITLVIGEINVGKSHFIEQCMGLSLSVILKRTNQIICYQNEKQYFLEYTIDWNNHETIFIADVLLKLSDLTILINDSFNQQQLKFYDKWNNLIIVHKYCVQEQREFLIKNKKLKQIDQFIDCYHRKGQIHLFYNQEDTYLKINLFKGNKDNRLTLLQSLQETLNNSTYLLPFKVELQQLNKTIQLKQKIQNHNVVIQYIEDYYNNSQQILKFTQNKDYTLITITRQYLKISNCQVEIDKGYLLLDIMLRDLRFNFIIPFLYKRQCKFMHAQLIIQQEDFIILQLN